MHWQSSWEMIVSLKDVKGAHTLMTLITLPEKEMENDESVESDCSEPGDVDEETQPKMNPGQGANLNKVLL